jgi:two-component system cell cycle sensor histidine kinase/response regulator CckA
MGRVLLVEDEPVVLDLMTMILEDVGWTVHAYANGEAARAAFAGERPDVLVTDVVMAPGDGVQLAREARGQWPGLPVLFVSGYTPDHLTLFRRENPDAAFLRKPFDVEQLVAAVERAARADV